MGGYGRRELAPYSDLDVVLVHADDRDVAPVATRIWYPLWDAAPAIDHAVRAESEVLTTATADLRVHLGLLDMRHLAGDPSLTMRVRSAVLTHWRQQARRLLPQVEASSLDRVRRAGELGHASVPDLKESGGGLRDATTLNALVMSWLVDVPHADLERCRQQILDVRDVLHGVAGRATDRITPELWAPLAEGLGLVDAEAAQRHVRGAGRRITHIARLMWHRVDAVLDRPPVVLDRRPHLEPVAEGVALSSNEVVLARGAEPGRDPLLLLRAIVEAAERGVPLNPVTAARLARECPPPLEPWSPEARGLFVRFLAAGPGLLPVWETLEETGALLKVVPEWSEVRLLPHASAVHRFTVDRHMVETVIEASQLIRRVTRPDLLLVAALLHDLGKATTGDHSITGEPLAYAAALRLGFDAADATVIGLLVRWHLLLSTVATTRDLADPATVSYVAERITEPETLQLLEVLTEADAKATGPQAWTAWRASLVADLVRRVRRAYAAGAAEAAAIETVPIPKAARKGRVSVETRTTPSGSQLVVVAPDRVGRLVTVSGALAMMRVSVLAAHASVQDGYSVSVWDVDEPLLDLAILRQRIDGVADGTLDPAQRLGPPAGDLGPAVMLREGVSADSTVIEVRATDRVGVLFRVFRALASAGVDVRTALLSTLGPQTLDVFYVREPGGGVLDPERADAAIRAVAAALTGSAPAAAR